MSGGAETTVGWQRHEEAVRRLRESYAAIPPGAPVRLAKKTTNLFRVRTASHTPGLDVSGLNGVIEVDPTAKTADVQGMCTYEDLVDVTLAYGLVPYVVPQLRTIALGGAVTGLGIESPSFRHGLPHESVLEMDVLTGSGEIVTARPGDSLHGDIFDTFPNSYGSLGYATRIKIELESVPPYVALRHLRFDDADLLAKTIVEIVEAREYDGVRVDGLDGVAFEPGEYYLTLATWADEPRTVGVGALDGIRQAPSDYTGAQVFYRSLQQRGSDVLSIYDYLWRWDTDWFWCSGAFGAQNPRLRRIWPAKYRRSDVYMKLLRLDRRFDIADRIDRRKGRPLRERVVQDVEVPVAKLPAFLEWFDAEIGMRPVWLCPLVAHRKWPSYPLEPGETYVNVGFWGTVHVGPDAPNAPKNRAIEAKVHELGGHKSLYSEAFYDQASFEALYDGDNLATVKERYDPNNRLTSLYDKAVRRR